MTRSPSVGVLIDVFTIPIFSGLPFISSLVVIQCSPCREENTNERGGICPISIVNPLCLPDQGNTNQELYPPIILKYCHLINRCLALGPIAIRARVYICNTGTSIPRTSGAVNRYPNPGSSRFGAGQRRCVNPHSPFPSPTLAHPDGDGRM